MTSFRNVGVLGASGYAGAELLRLLARHPDLDVAWAAGDSSAGQPLASRYPGLRAAYGELTFCSVDEGLEKGADVLFCALPHGRAAELAPRALAAAGLVVDLSADFRLRDPGAYPAWYGGAPVPRASSATALRPARAATASSCGRRRVAVPGCYPTAALLALAPLVAAGLVAADGIVVDAKSGLSGAGRSLADGNLFVQANENVAPYKVGSHRHTPEIEQELALAAGGAGDGDLHARTWSRPAGASWPPATPPCAPSAGDQELAACYATAYGGEPFVDLLEPATGWPATRAVGHHQPGPGGGRGRPPDRPGGGRRGHRQPGQGRRRPGRAVRQPRPRPAGDGRASTSSPPARDHVRVDRRLGVTAAAGFGAAGVGCGLKPSGAPDLALVVGDPGTVAAGVFTTNLVVAAPVVGRGTAWPPRPTPGWWC